MKTLDELDQLAAEHVMEWEVILELMPEEQTHYFFNGFEYKTQDWQPTRNIAQAWELIAKLATEEWKSTIYAGHQKQSCVIFKYSESFHEYGETIEESIVRACLLSKGIEID